MKKFYYFLSVMLLTLVSFGVTSCGDDKDEPKSSDLVGTWQFKAVTEDAAIEAYTGQCTHQLPSQRFGC